MKAPNHNYKDFDSTKILNNRMIFAAANPEKPAEAPKSVEQVNIYHPDFDKKVLNGKSAEVNKGKPDINDSIKKLVESISDLSEKNKEIITAELQQALKEQVDLNGLGTIDQFNNSLKNNNCEKVELTYKAETDQLIFKFKTTEGNEINFNKPDIAIYFRLPERQKTELEVSKENKKTALEELVPNPQEGDIVSIKRGSTLLRAIYRQTDGWVLETYKKPVKVTLIPGDNLTFIPRSADSTETEKMTVNIEGKEMPIVGRITLAMLDKNTDIKGNDSFITYNHISQAILETPADVFELGVEVVQKIQSTKISVEDYAKLLEEAHKQTSKYKDIPVILPPVKKQADTETKQKAEAEEAGKTEKQRAEGEKQMQEADLDRTVVLLRQKLGAKDAAKVNAIIRKNLPRITPQDKKTYNNAFWSEVNNYFSESGFERKVNPEITDLIEDQSAWLEAWKENKLSGTEALVLHYNRYESVLGGPKKPLQLAKAIGNAIAEGKNTNIYPADLIAALGVKLPSPFDKSDYEEIQAAALIPENTGNPVFENWRKIAIQFTTAIEGLTELVSQLALAQRTASAGFERSKGQERLSEDKKLTKTMNQLLQQMNVESASPIKPNPSNPEWYETTFTLNGRKALLQVNNVRLGGWDISVRDERGNQIYQDYDAGSIDIAEQARAITESVNALQKTVKSRLKTKDTYIQQGESFYSLNGLEQLNAPASGVSFKDYPDIDENIQKYAGDFLRAIGCYETAKMYDTPENRQEFADNDSVILNVNYQGRPLTIKFENNTESTRVLFSNGYNNLNFVEKYNAVISGVTVRKGDIERLASIFAAKISQAPEFIDSQKTKSEKINSIGLSKYKFEEFNNKLEIAAQNQAGRINFRLSESETIELLFRLYSFEDLNKQGCIQKVWNTERQYMITKLPAELSGEISSQVLKLASEIKGKQEVSGETAENAREVANKQKVYRQKLGRIFGIGTTAYDENGRKISMGESEAGQKTEIAEEKIGSIDEYFSKMSGDSAYEFFFDKVKTRDPQTGEEKIDLAKANTELNSLYKLGYARLQKLAKDSSNPKYKKLLQISPTAKQFNIAEDSFSQTDIEILRLGMLESQERIEENQLEKAEKLKHQIRAELEKMIDDKSIPMTKEELEVAMEQFPVSLLISYQRMALKPGGEKENIFGLHVPIVLYGGKNSALVLVPGIDTTGRLNLAVGVTGTAEVSDRVNFVGGLSVGPYTHLGEGGTGVGAAAIGGVEFKVVKADRVDNYNQFLGITGSVGIDLASMKLGVDAGVYYKWKLDAQQKMKNDIDAAFEKDGILKYTDELEKINKLEGDKKSAALNKLAEKIKKDTKTLKLIGATAEMPNLEVIAYFKQYVKNRTRQVIENFEYPTIAGAQVGAGVQTGVAMIIGGLTAGPIGLIAAGIGEPAIRFLASLEIVVDQDTFLTRKQKSSETQMDIVGEYQRREAVDKEFESLEKSEAAQKKLETSGQSTLDKQGKIRTSMSEYQITETPSAGLNEYNQKLLPLGIKLNKDSQNRLELNFLESETDGNTKMLFGPDLVTVEGGKIYLKHPNSLSNLYIDRHDRYYPFETSHGANKETVITISTNRYFNKENIPRELEIVKYKDKPREIKTNLTSGSAEQFSENRFDLTAHTAAHDKMAAALSSSLESEEKVRDAKPSFDKKLYEAIYKFKDSEGNTFLSLTNADVKSGEAADYNKEKLYAFFQEYANSNSIPEFNAVEMEKLTLELTTLRYRKLQPKADKEGKIAPNALEIALRDRLEYMRKNIVLPYFEARIAELNARAAAQTPPGKKIEKTAEELSKKLISDLGGLSVRQQYDQISRFTSVAVGVGRGAKGFHHMLNSDPENSSEYGYVIGKDYTPALRSGEPVEDHEIALILMGQLSPLPEKPLEDPAKLKEFLNSPLARKVASLKNLSLVLGIEKYNKLADFYANLENFEDRRIDAVTEFVEIVQKIRETQEAGRAATVIKGTDGQEYIFTVNQRIRSGIFTKCGNLSIFYEDEIGILPPNTPEGMQLLATQGSTLTTVETGIQHTATTFGFGGFAAIDLSEPKPAPKEETPPPPKEETPPPAPAPKPAPGVAQRSGTGEGGTVEVPPTIESGGAGE